MTSKAGYGEGRRPIRDDGDDPPGTSRNPITGEVRERQMIGGSNQHHLGEEDADPDTTSEFRGAPIGRSTSKEA